MDTQRLNYLEKKVYTRITFDNTTKIWYIGTDQDERIFGKRNLREALDQACDYTVGGLEDKKDRDDDSVRVNFMGKAIFNSIKFDNLTQQWIIGDRESNVPVSINSDLRLAIDRLIS